MILPQNDDWNLLYCWSAAFSSDDEHPQLVAIVKIINGLFKTNLFNADTTSLKKYNNYKKNKKDKPKDQ